MNDSTITPLQDLVLKLSSDTSKEKWVNSFSSIVSELLERKLNDILTEETLRDVLNRSFPPNAIAQTILPIGRIIADQVIKQLQTDQNKLLEYVPDAAQTKIKKILEQPKLIPPQFIRDFVESDAIEEVILSTFTDGIREFIEKVNPFFSEGGFLSVLKKISPLGFGFAGKGMETIRTEFDKRIEPEIKKFVKDFAKSSLRKMADFAIARSDEPNFVAFRKKLVFCLLEQRIGETVGVLTLANQKLAQDLGVEVANHVYSMPSVVKNRDQFIHWFWTQYGDVSIRNILEQCGAKPIEQLEPIAEMLWPLIRSVMRTKSFEEWLGENIHIVSA